MRAREIVSHGLVGRKNQGVAKLFTPHSPIRGISLSVCLGYVESQDSKSWDCGDGRVLIWPFDVPVFTIESGPGFIPRLNLREIAH